MTCAGYLVVAVAFWAVALLAGVALANRVLAARGVPPAPDHARPLPPLAVWHAAAVVAVTGFANTGLTFAAGVLAAGVGAGELAWLGLPVLYLAASAILSSSLSAPLGRAAVAVLFQWLVAAPVWVPLAIPLVKLAVRP